MIDHNIFEDLQAKIDEEAAVRDVRRSTQAILSRAHSTPTDQLKPVLDDATKEIIAQRDEVSRLKTVADKHPFYKYNGVWTRELQNLEQDAFHLTIEEYLLALISMVEELARLAVNSVTLGDYTRPVQIGNFIKDLFAGFQLLNLKNDILRKRSDGIKYSVKKVEDVVYDLSLRNLIPKGSAAA
ncbi:hypothetical protein ASPNIDRAFT_136694 [Aspergillus niger ATCC 1015]|uniref:Uncharacterized protein n=1 Tax=Aspergillus niger (strain ATCC 1015 / CBS 113.46 / FGSC A1144 / LSHB Ac4 / NCTC 3858a / NRRL 328 / USDA 3528.7) TaxID=380704 RepID=G3Y3U0_ASPNA|nr:hypothetical protein ASPNIDRAFT_136694 [Aspergillus niger ATCC 1015]